MMPVMNGVARCALCRLRGELKAKLEFHARPSESEPSANFSLASLRMRLQESSKLRTPGKLAVPSAAVAPSRGLSALAAAIFILGIAGGRRDNKVVAIRQAATMEQSRGSASGVFDYGNLLS